LRILPLWSKCGRLDRYDRQILAILQADGRISNQDLADRIGLSPSPCLRRVRALEESGLIAGYRAYLDAKKLGLTLMALIGISMDQHTPERFANLEAPSPTFRGAGMPADHRPAVGLPVEGRGARHGRLPGSAAQQDHAHHRVTGVHTSFVLRKVIERTSLPLP
jgi:Lrp/AsnC family leucine-responsive transcriptional regulator